MIYNDDSCSECGGIRVSGSKLCISCLVRSRRMLENGLESKIEEVKALKEKVEKLTVLCGRLLDQITENVIYDSEHMQAIYASWAKKQGRN